MGEVAGGQALIAGLAGMLLCTGAAAAPHQGSYAGTADDFVQISQLFARYDFSIDNGDGIGWADNFTPDGVFQDPSWCAIGRKQLIGVVGTSSQLGKDQEHHHVPAIGPILYADRNHATVHSTVMVVSEKGAGHPDGGIGITGTYDDSLMRVGGRWLFAYRLVHRPSAKPSVACSATPPRPPSFAR